jgi:HEAT repeat protein
LGSPDEQVFQGKPTSYWVKGMHDVNPEALSALNEGRAKAVPVLLEAVTQEDVTVRSLATSILYRTARADKDALTLFIDALKREEPTVRLVAVGAISQAIGRWQDSRRPIWQFVHSVPALVSIATFVQRIVEYAIDLRAKERWRPDRMALPALRRALADDSQKVRIQVINVIISMRADARAAFPELVQQTRDPDEIIRGLAIDAVRAISPEPKDAAPVLIEALHDNSLANREKAAFALSSFTAEAKPAFTALVELMNEQAAEGRLSSAVDILSKLGPEGEAAVIGPIMDLLHNENTSVRSSALTALSRLGPAAKPAIPTVIEMLKDRQQGLRLHCAMVLSNLGPTAKPAVPALIEMLNDKDTCFAAARALLKIDPESAKSAIPILERMARESDQLHAVGSIRVLYEIDRKAARKFAPALMDWVKNGRRIDAARLLILIEPGSGPAVVPTVIEIFSTDASPGTRTVAADILKTLGPKARAAVPALSRALADTNPHIRRLAAKALLAIDPEAAARAGVKDSFDYAKPHGPPWLAGP